MLLHAMPKNSEEEGGELFRKYNIILQRLASKSDFPAHRKTSSRKVKKLRQTNFQTYCQNDNEQSKFLEDGDDKSCQKSSRQNFQIG
jgi:hypothetical protein